VPDRAAVPVGIGHARRGGWQWNLRGSQGHTGVQEQGADFPVAEGAVLLGQALDRLAVGIPANEFGNRGRSDVVAILRWTSCACASGQLACSEDHVTQGVKVIGEVVMSKWCEPPAGVGPVPVHLQVSGSPEYPQMVGHDSSFGPDRVCDRGEAVPLQIREHRHGEQADRVHEQRVEAVNVVGSRPVRLTRPTPKNRRGSTRKPSTAGPSSLPTGRR
jgi:hypothetical protein